MKIKYLTIDLRKPSGIYKSEKLRARGWKVGAAGFSTIQLSKEQK